MKKISEWKKEATCRNCGDIFEIRRLDVNAQLITNNGRRKPLELDRIRYSFSCPSCKKSTGLPGKKLPTLIKISAENKGKIDKSEIRHINLVD